MVLDGFGRFRVLVTTTEYRPSMPDRKHNLMNNWHLIQNQHSLRKKFKNPCNKRPHQETAECHSGKSENTKRRSIS